MHGKLIHGHVHVDLETVWETAARDIPSLLPDLEAVAKQME
jgi:uncharacterized protein with HEPN domain